MHQTLLDAFQAFPKAKQNRTVMQVSGYPHYENVCSNILAFFFDPEEEHGLKDLLLQSLFKVIPKPTPKNDEKKDAPSFVSVKIEREHRTDGNKRIDLVITGENFTIGIENKIHHWLDNDLEHYSQRIDNVAAQNPDAENQYILKTVLGLHPIATEELKGDFNSITYTDLWQEVQQELGNYLPNASQKWVTYLLDFIETTKQLTRPNMKLTENDQFFIEHDEEIIPLFEEREDFYKRLYHQVFQLQGMLLDQGDANSPLAEVPWMSKARVGKSFYRHCVVLDFRFDNTHKISCDLWLYPSGWQLQIFCRDDVSHTYMKKLIEQPEIKNKATKILPSGERFILQKWGTLTPPENIFPDILDWIKILPEAAANLPEES